MMRNEKVKVYNNITDRLMVAKLLTNACSPETSNVSSLVVSSVSSTGTDVATIKYYVILYNMLKY